MRNDLKDEPLEIPSLLVDDMEPKQKRQTKPEAPVIVAKRNGASKGFVVSIVLLLFIIYTVSISILFLLFKQSTDDLRYQLEQTTHTAASAAEVSQQQALTSNGLENIRNQNKLLTEKIIALTTKQNALANQLAEQSKRLGTIEQQLTLLASNAKQIDQIKQLSADLVNLKKSQDALSGLANDVKTLQSQNVSQSLKSVQDDLLLLRAQVDRIQASDTSQQTVSQLTKQVESLQLEMTKLRQQVSNMSPY